MPHKDLLRCLDKHRANAWLQPVLAASQAAFNSIAPWLHPERELILDSGCGTGHSTVGLAERYPEGLVLGIDQSQARLNKSPSVPNNARLIRARAEDVWRLLLDRGLSASQHYLLYPNPWPKPRHLMRRWHAHPAFPSLIQLGGQLELRTNWKPYAEEFQIALEYYSRKCGLEVIKNDTQPTTLFERKYIASGHTLYRLISLLQANQPGDRYDS